MDFTQRLQTPHHLVHYSMPRPVNQELNQ